MIRWFNFDLIGAFESTGDTMLRRGEPNRSASAATPAELSRRLAELEGTVRELRGREKVLREIRDRLGRLPERLEMIARMGQELAVLDLDKVADVAARRVPAIAGARLSSLYLLDEETGELALLAHNHPVPLNRRVDLRSHPDSVMAAALRSDRPLLIPDLGTYAGAALQRPFAHRYGTAACVSVPLRADRLTLGVLNFADREDGAAFDAEADLPGIEEVSRMLARTILNCRRVRELESQARTDGLTRLANYRAFQEALRAEINRSERYGRPLSLVMMDVDAFKEINDRFGHPAGDAALAGLGEVIRRAVRREDLPARYGGDEIAVLLPETAPHGCRVAAHRLLEAVRGHEFLFEGRRLPVSVSIGVATLKPGMSISGLVGAADEALYRAKERGRDRFEVAG